MRRRPIAVAVPPRGTADLALVAALLGGWIACFWPTARWIVRTFAEPTLRLNLGIAVAVLGGCAWRAIDAARGLRSTERGATGASAPGAATGGSGWRVRARLERAPLLVCVGSLAAYLALERYVDLDLLSAVAFGLGSYGLLGLFVPTARWRSGLPVALVLVAALPFGEQASGYAGFAARVATANAVGRLFAALHIGAITTQGIILLENGVAHVDAPCSGVRSLWTGLLVLLVATWLDRRALGLRWVVAGLLYGAALVAGNFTRVALIVLVGLHAGLHDAAEIVHAPLGILAFAAATALLLVALHRLVPSLPGRSCDAPEHPPRTLRDGRDGRAWVVALAAGFALAACLHTRRPTPPTGGARFHLALPAAVSATPLPLSDAESDLVRRFGATGATADKVRFTWRGVSGSALFVYAESWRAHHPPELCLAGGGHRIDTLATVDASREPARAGDDRARYRRVLLDGGTREALAWFQSDRRTAADLLDRIAGQLWHGERRWVQVSVLLDHPLPDGSPVEDELYRDLRASVARSLAATPLLAARPEAPR